jgi:hypothetical protein
MLTDKQIAFIFKKYKENSNREFSQQNTSFLMGGTLIILVCSLFMNAGAGMSIKDDSN